MNDGSWLHDDFPDFETKDNIKTRKKSLGFSLLLHRENWITSGATNYGELHVFDSIERLQQAIEKVAVRAINSGALDCVPLNDFDFAAFNQITRQISRRTAEATAPEQISLPINQELVQIQNLLDLFHVYISWTGARYLIGNFGSVEMDSVAQNLKNISQQRRFNPTDQTNGIACVEKMRTLYEESDFSFFAKARDAIDFFISIPSILGTFIFFGATVLEYSPRDCIFGDGMYSVGPESIELNFRTR